MSGRSLLNLEYITARHNYLATVHDASELHTDTHTTATYQCTVRDTSLLWELFLKYTLYLDAKYARK